MTRRSQCRLTEDRMNIRASDDALCSVLEIERIPTKIFDDLEVRDMLVTSTFKHVGLYCILYVIWVLTLLGRRMQGAGGL